MFFSNQFSEFKYVNANNLSQYQKLNINISMYQLDDFKRYIKSPQFEFGLFLSANTEDFYYYYDNFNIVPSGKHGLWLLLKQIQKVFLKKMS